MPNFLNSKKLGIAFPWLARLTPFMIRYSPVTTLFIWMAPWGRETLYHICTIVTAKCDSSSPLAKSALQPESGRHLTLFE